MCPFCIAALALVAAKAVAATGGGAIVAKVVMNNVRKGDDSSAAQLPGGKQAINSAELTRRKRAVAERNEIHSPSSTATGEQYV